MTELIIFQSGNRYIRDSQNMVFTENPAFITDRIDLSNATDEETATLKDNPYNDELIEQIQKRNVDFKPA